VFAQHAGELIRLIGLGHCSTSGTGRRAEERNETGQAFGRLGVPICPLRQHCLSEGKRVLLDASERRHLSARGYHRVLRVARTLADLDQSDGGRRIRVAEALSYRRILLSGDLLGR
jgi:hypothetical protein